MLRKRIGDRDVAYTRAVEITQRLGNPLGQDIWGGLFLGQLLFGHAKRSGSPSGEKQM